MESDPALAALGDELERLGFVVVPHGQHVCVRLPLLASVVVRTAGGTLRLQPKFGPFKRSSALVLGAVGLPAAVAAVLAALGPGLASFGAAAGAAAYLLTDVYRLILTESCGARLQALWAERGAAPRHVRAPVPGGGVARLPGSSPEEGLQLPGGDRLGAVAPAKIRAESPST